MAPPGTSEPKKAEKSYLASAVDSINPWASSRSTTPTPRDPKPDKPSPSTPPAPAPGPISTAVDHSTNPFYGQSLKRYPPDCPPANVQWFHAADIPKRKPKFLQDKNSTAEDKKAAPQPKKYVPFSASDSRSLETAYQKKLQEYEDEKKAKRDSAAALGGKKRPRVASVEEGRNTSLDGKYGGDGSKRGTKVPVNEDFLFDVDIEERELGPVYWEGPIYDVRRGSWFYQEGSTLRPCEENLAAQLEEGYLKIRPWLYPSRMRSGSGTQGVPPGASSDNTKVVATTQSEAKPNAEGAVATAHQPQTYRLFGAYMNSVATFQDANTAWLSSDGVLSWVTSTVYERFAGGGYMSGVKLVRGYTEPKKAKEEKRPSTPTGTKSSLSVEQDEKTQKALKRRSAPASVRSDSVEIVDPKDGSEPAVKFESTQARLTRQLSNLIEGGDRDAENEAIRKREEKEIQDDYNAQQGETQGRDIEHLVLVTHGIGQLLGLRMESVNFVHDVNVLRKTLKGVYSASEDLRALNSEIGETGPGNCRVQVLPVVWRHLLDFPKRRQKKGEHDLGEQFTEEDEYPSLEDITIEGMAFARSLISDLALDVLLYQSAYREQIADIVSKESNRIYKLFMERNPDFKGKVHIVGHSLGSAIMFDILCRQREKKTLEADHHQPRNPLRFWPTQDRYEPKDPKDLAFDFDVEDFYCLGSPVGLFQMLKGRTIAARHLPNSLPSESPLNPDYIEDPFLSIPPPQLYNTADQRVSPITGLPFSISSPKTAQLFNIFHPSDPIAYRLEPLISPVMSTLKPQILPYTKKSIFGSVAPQGLTGIGAKVGQSVSGLWSSFSAGIASSLLNRSLGLSQEDVARFQQQQQQAQQAQAQQSPGAGTNIIGGGVLPPGGGSTGGGSGQQQDMRTLSDAQRSERTAERMRKLAAARGGSGVDGGSGNEATLIDDELETLFSRFQKKRIDIAKGGEGDAAGEGSGVAAAVLSEEELLEEEQRAQKLRREELKVRALNRNGRVDYCIQESVLDFNPINTIASHMSYWGDEDVGHFVLSQMLSANKGRTPVISSVKK